MVAAVLPEQWVIPDEALLDEYEGDLHDEELWPTTPEKDDEPEVDDQNVPSTPKPHTVEQGGWCVRGPSAQIVVVNQTSVLLDPDPSEFSKWKLALLGTILLMTLLASLSLAYYMCVWRGGRIYYDLQKDVSV